MLSRLIFEQIFIHIRRSLNIKNIKKLSNKSFAELFSLQTLSPVSFTLTVPGVQDFTENNTCSYMNNEYHTVFRTLSY